MADTDYTKVADGPLCPTARLVSAITPLQQVFFIDNLIALGFTDLISIGKSFMVDDEIMVILNVLDAETMQLSIGRGCADTIPAEHAEDAIVWFYEESTGTVETEYAKDEVIGVKVLPRTTSGGTVPVAAVPPNELTFTGRAFAPYPPGQMKVNGDPWFTPGFALDAFNNSFRLTWARRNRLTQADQFVDHNAETVLPEVGQTTVIYVYNADGDVLLRVYEVSVEEFTYTASMANSDFGFLDMLDPPDSNGYLMVHARREGVNSVNGYRIDFVFEPETTVEQPFGLGYRLGELLGGFPGGIAGDFALVNADFMFEVDGKLVYSKRKGGPTTDIYVSEDNGRTFYLAVFDGPHLAYYDGIRRWRASMGDQWVMVGINRYALDYGIYDGTGSDLTTSNFVDEGPFTDDAKSLHCGFFGKIGSYYYVVARYAEDNDINDNLGVFYLFRAGTDLEFELVGQMTKHPTDPNGIPDDQQGSFTSWWFTPNGSSPGIYESYCTLWRGYGGRWFCKNTTQLYYTDDANGLVNWKRCAIPKYDSHLPYNTRPLTVVPHPSNGTLFAHYAGLPIEGLYRSVDNGVTWVTQAIETSGFTIIDTLLPAVYFDSLWMTWVYRVDLGTPTWSQSQTANAVWPAVAPTPIQGILPEDDAEWQFLDLVTADTIIGRDGLLRQIYTEDGINFEYAIVTVYGVVFLQNFTTDESDETGTTTPVLWNDAAVSGGVVQFSGDGYMRVPQPFNTFNFGKQDFTFEVFVQIDGTGSALPNQWVMVYGDLPNERNSSAMSIDTFSSGSSSDVAFRVRVQFRNATGAIITHMMDTPVTYDVDVLHHVVIQRRGLRLEFFVNGVLIEDSDIEEDRQTFGRTTGAAEDVFFGGGPEVGGTGTGSDNPMTGSISATRLTRGTVVYPYAGFTPPSLPLTA